MVVVFRLNDRNLKKEKVKGNPEKYSIVENEEWRMKPLISLVGLRTAPLEGLAWG
jgi:hypothetical protein